ncbi:hypothetical protein VTJ49DRAFT_1986 [Mycothermus thermophilus]|uniref:chitin deacetylase n=1 Tax=Humicola insolens TaxID=85995 RepID=A0ABR3VCA6_HUMIN
MHLRNAAILVAVGLASVHAAVIRSANASIVLLSSEQFEGGRIETWGYDIPLSEVNNSVASSPKVAQAQPQACGGNHVHCADSNKTAYQVCEGLIGRIAGDPHKLVDPRAVGMWWVNTDVGWRCGVSWFETVPGLKQGHLVPAAYKILYTCSSAGYISGQMFPSLRFPLGRRLRRRRMATLALAVFVLFAVVLPLYTIYKPPSFLIRHLSRRWTDVLFRVWLPPSKKLVALTIDDAPSDHTPAILAALAASGAHATFFVIGSQVRGREHILRDIVRAGHELANHGMRDEPAARLDTPELISQIIAVQRLIDDAYRAEGLDPPPGPSPDTMSTLLDRNNANPDGDSDTDPLPGNSPRWLRRYYRPGSGFFSERIRGVARRLGYRVVLGSIYPHDAQISSSWLNGRHILSMLSPGGIIICHDRRSWTEPMLRRVLPEMRRRGYRAVTLTELLEEVTG